MCLERIDNSIKDTLPESGYYWKVVWVANNRYYPEFRHSGSFSKGINISPRKRLLRNNAYIPYFHAFRHRKDAVKWAGGFSYLKVIRCKIKKEDISTTGWQRNKKVVVAKKIWMPKYK
jgi:hypothetical protein